MKENILELIDKKSIISFDIFDTLLFRNVYKPTDIFKIVEKKYGKEIDFESIRINSENQAREEEPSGEINIDDIYDFINKKYQLSKDDCDKLKKLELETELEFIEANPFMQEIFNYCLKNNKKIILISDMYLKEDFIKELLLKNNYKIDCPIYVSNVYKKNKGTGELYEVVKESENISYDNWFHIGDNIYSDVEIPKSLGITSYEYKNINSYDNAKYDSIFESITLAIRNNYVYSGIENNYWKLFGVKNLVSIYLGFTNWIYQMTYDFDNLYFIARDGYIIKKIYNLFPKSNNKYIDYLYCSRKSLQVPSMILGSKDYMINFLTPVIDDKTTLGRLFQNCQLEPDKKYEKIIKLYGFKSFDDIVLPEDRHRAVKCICYFIDDITKKLDKDFEIAKKYLLQEKMDAFDTIHVVDIGWGGSIQEAIQKILNKKVKGFYLGTLDLKKEDYLTNSFGYLFDQGVETDVQDRIYPQVMMYELIFSAPHGTTSGYREYNKKIEPILKDNDINEDIVSLFQSSSIDIIKKILKYYKYYDSLSNDFCIQFYDKFLNSYNYEDLINFSKYSNDYLLGDDRTFPYVQKFSKKYIENYYSIFKEKIKKSLWNGAYLIEDCKNEDEQKEFITNMENIVKNMEEQKEIITNTEEQKEINTNTNDTIQRTLFRRIVPLKIRSLIKKIIKL